MLMASFVGGLGGIPGKQTRYASPRTFEHALLIALTIQEAENQVLDPIGITVLYTSEIKL